MHEEKAYVNVFNAWNENIKTSQSLRRVGVFRISFVERDRHVFRQIVNKAKDEKWEANIVKIKVVKECIFRRLMTPQSHDGWNDYDNKTPFHLNALECI